MKILLRLLKNENNNVTVLTDIFVNASTRSIKENEFTCLSLRNISAGFSLYFSVARLSAERLLELSLL